jgi:hypothetical protein
VRARERYHVVLGPTTLGKLREFFDDEQQARGVLDPAHPISDFFSDDAHRDLVLTVRWTECYRATQTAAQGCK